MLAVSLGGAEDRPAALVPPALAASAAAADREGQALLARRDKAAHAVVAALQVRPRWPPPELPCLDVASEAATLARGCRLCAPSEVQCDIPS